MSARLDPDKLRAQAGDLLVPEAACPMLADALEIADESAEVMIECETWRTRGDDDVDWYALETSHDPDLTEEANERIRANLDQAARYLEARGLLVRHGDKPNLVRFVERPE